MDPIKMLYSLNSETQAFLVLIAIFALLFHATYTHSTADKAPAFLTTLGILGTFIGIAIGLMDFNTMDISKSVPTLIEGVKTAVWASAFGIFCALTIKMRDIEGFVKRKKPGPKAASVEELIAALHAVEKALIDHSRAAPVQVQAALRDIQREEKIAPRPEEKNHSVQQSEPIMAAEPEPVKFLKLDSDGYAEPPVEFKKTPSFESEAPAEPDQWYKSTNQF